jgi:hypothetical protein
MQRLTNDNYDKPPVTFTESLSTEEIKKSLEGYEQVNNIGIIKKGTHLRYFSKNEDDTYKFRLGGKLIVNNSTISKYIVLSNKSKTWSVQIKDTVFYAKKLN